MSDGDLASKIWSPAKTDIESNVYSWPSVPPPLLATPIPYILKSEISCRATRWIAFPLLPPAGTVKSIIPWSDKSTGYIQEPSSAKASESKFNAKGSVQPWTQGSHDP